MIFIDVTLKFRYKPIISNDFIYKTTLPKKGKLNRKMSLYAFLFCRVYFIAYIASNGVGPHVLPTPQDTKHKGQNTKLESQKFETQNSKHPYTKHNVPYRLP